MKIFLILLLISISVEAADTDVRFVSLATTNSETGAVITTETFTRDGQTNLVRVTKVQAGAVVFRSQQFCHDGQPVALLSWRDGAESFSTVAGSPYRVEVDYLPSKEVRRVIIFGRDFIDGFYPTNGIYYPAPDSEVGEWPEEPEIRRFLAGTWAGEDPLNTKMTFYADGRFERSSTNATIVRGTWKVFRPDGSLIRVSTEGQDCIFTIRHVDEHLLILLPPYETVLPPQKPLRFTR